MSAVASSGTVARRAAPSLVVVLAVAGAGMGTVVVTAFGLMPLYGEPRLSLDGWRLDGGDLVLGVRETLVIASASTVVACLVGLLLASLVLAAGPAARAVQVAAVVVLALPHLVGAVSIDLLLRDGGLAQRVVERSGLLGVGATGAGTGEWPRLVGGPLPVATVAELAWKESAFIALVVVATLGAGHRARVEAAAVLGASPWQRWTRVVLPASLPAVGASGLIVFVYTVGNYEVAWLLGRAYPEPLPVLAYRLFGSVDLGDRPAAAAAAVVTAALALGVVLVVAALLPRLAHALSLGVGAGGADGAGGTGGADAADAAGRPR